MGVDVVEGTKYHWNCDEEVDYPGQLGEVGCVAFPECESEDFCDEK